MPKKFRKLPKAPACTILPSSTGVCGSTVSDPGKVVVLNFAAMEVVHGLLNIFKISSCAVQIMQRREFSKILCASTVHVEFKRSFPAVCFSVIPRLL